MKGALPGHRQCGLPRRRFILAAPAFAATLLTVRRARAETKIVEDSKLDIDFGSQIRSYVLQPYRMVKDLRTRVEIGDVDRVLDGDLNELIRGYLLLRRKEQRG